MNLEAQTYLADFDCFPTVFLGFGGRFVFVGPSSTFFDVF